MLNEGQITEALKLVKYPGYSRDIISFGLVKEISAANGAVSVALQLSNAAPEVAARLKTETETVLRNLPGVQRVHVEVRNAAAAGAGSPNPWANQNKVPGIKR